MGNWREKKTYLDKLVSCFSQIWQIRFKKNISCERLGSKFYSPRPQSWNSVHTTGKVDSIWERTSWFKGSGNLAMHEFIVAGAKCEIFWRRPRGFKISWRRPQGFDISWMRPQHLEEASKCLGVGFEISLRRLRNILEESLMLIRRKPHFNHQSISFHKERQHINTILINQTCLYFCCGHYCLSSSAENILHFR